MLKEHIAFLQSRLEADKEQQLKKQQQKNIRLLMNR